MSQRSGCEGQPHRVRTDRGHRRPPRRVTTKFLVLFLAVATLLGGFTALGPQSQGTATAPAHDDDDPETQLWVRGHSES